MNLFEIREGGFYAVSCHIQCRVSSHEMLLFCFLLVVGREFLITRNFWSVARKHCSIDLDPEKQEGPAYDVMTTNKNIKQDITYFNMKHLNVLQGGLFLSIWL